MVVNQQTDQLICTGCNQQIKDRFFFQVDNHKLHYDCLKCSNCKCFLNGKCWYKQNKFYCKKDYDGLIQLMSSCIVCKKLIEKNTLKHSIYNINVHLDCFRCCECNRILNTGDNFVLIKDDKFACSFHFNQKYLNINRNEISHSHQSNSINSSIETEIKNLSTHHLLNRNDQPASHHPIYSNSIETHLNQHNSNSMNLIDYSIKNLSENDKSNDNEIKFYYETNFYDSPFYEFNNYESNSFNSPTNQPTSDSIDKFWTHHIRQQTNENLNTHFQSLQRKGRPKKKKQIDNAKIEHDLITTIDTIALNEHDLNNLNSSNSSSSFNQMRLISSNSSTSSTNSSTSGTTRVKRNRTSFKPQQLRRMKEYFKFNKNPESKDLIQLSKETSLSKRTLQVWFQNSRAIHRRRNKEISMNVNLHN